MIEQIRDALDALESAERAIRDLRNALEQGEGVGKAEFHEVESVVYFCADIERIKKKLSPMLHRREADLLKTLKQKSEGAEYPTKEQARLIKEWPSRDLYGLLAFIHKITIVGPEGDWDWLLTWKALDIYICDIKARGEKIIEIMKSNIDWWNNFAEQITESTYLFRDKPKLQEGEPSDC